MTWRDDWRPSGDERYRRDGEGDGAIYDYSEAGALLLQCAKDPAFAATLRDLVPQGFISVARKPFHWVIDADYADDALDLCRSWFDWVEHGEME